MPQWKPKIERLQREIGFEEERQEEAANWRELWKQRYLQPISELWEKRREPISFREAPSLALRGGLSTLELGTAPIQEFGKLLAPGLVPSFRESEERRQAIEKARGKPPSEQLLEMRKAWEKWQGPETEIPFLPAFHFPWTPEEERGRKWKIGAKEAAEFTAELPAWMALPGARGARAIPKKIPPIRRPLPPPGEVLPLGVKLPKGVPEVKPPITPGVAPPLVAPEATVAKLTNALKEIKKVRATMKPLRKEELSRKFGAAEEALQTIKNPEEAFNTAMSRLKEALPKGDVSLIGKQFTEQEGAGLLNMIRGSQFKVYEQIRARTALQKIMETDLVLQPNEIKLLGAIFGKDLASTLLKTRQSMGSKAFTGLMDVMNLPRAILASFDNSFLLRQGAPMVPSHPIAASKTFMRSLAVPWTEKTFARGVQLVESRPGTEFAKEMGLAITEWPVKGFRQLSKMEEPYMTRFARWIPGIKQSERAYVFSANDFRSRIWEGYMSLFERLGATELDYRELAKLINAATGRGSMPQQLTGASPLLNAIFFSPRLQLGRLQVPLMMASPSRIVRKEATKTLVRFLASGASVLSAASIGVGVTVEKDPRSSDFGKMRIGDTRLDIWGGYVQYARFIAQLITAQRKDPETGKITELNRRQVVDRFLQSKYSPAFGLLNDIFAGRSYMGEKMTLDPADLSTQARNRLVPMFIQDMIDAIEEEGILGGFLALPGFAGVGITSYSPRGAPARRRTTAQPERTQRKPTRGKAKAPPRRRP